MAITLNRIGWEDAPSEQTPIDSGNLKQMENNTEDAINELETKLQEQLDLLTPVTLWEGSTLHFYEITLNDKVSNYKRLKIFFSDNDGQIYCSEVYNNNNASSIRTYLSTIFQGDVYFTLKTKSVGINDTQGAEYGHASYEFSDNTISYRESITIFRIEGYKI